MSALEYWGFKVKFPRVKDWVMVVYGLPKIDKEREMLWNDLGKVLGREFNDYRKYSMEDMNRRVGIGREKIMLHLEFI